MLRSRHMCFWSAVNPSIYTSGMGMESKFKTLELLPEAYRPLSALLPAGTGHQERQSRIQRAGLAYPLIVKPDLGFRGLLVQLVSTPDEMNAYLDRFPVDFIAQEWLPHPFEAGVLYHRMPGEHKGQVTSVTTKEFLSVCGDGASTVLDLIHRHPRALLQLERIRQQYPDKLAQVPGQGELVSLGIVGNHAKGTRFINSNGLIGPELNGFFDELALQIPGFYYGRFDLKYSHPASLHTGEGLKIIELNGVCSEPTHIYDPAKGTYFSALRDIARHWGIISRIARRQRKAGVPVMTHRQTAKAFLKLFAYQKRVRHWSRAAAVPHTSPVGTAQG